MPRSLPCQPKRFMPFGNLHKWNLVGQASLLLALMAASLALMAHHPYWHFVADDDRPVRNGSLGPRRHYLTERHGRRRCRARVRRQHSCTGLRDRSVGKVPGLSRSAGGLERRARFLETVIGQERADSLEVTRIDLGNGGVQRWPAALHVEVLVASRLDQL